MVGNKGWWEVMWYNSFLFLPISGGHPSRFTGLVSFLLSVHTFLLDPIPTLLSPHPSPGHCLWAWVSNSNWQNEGSEGPQATVPSMAHPRPSKDLQDSFYRKNGVWRGGVPW